MNLTDAKYSRFALVREMLRTPEMMAQFSFGQVDAIVNSIRHSGRLFLTGEGSSRIFPSKRLISSMLRRGTDVKLATEGGRQAMEYDLTYWTVLGASNSGQTKELITLFRKLAEEGHPNLFGVTANAGTRLTEIAQSIVLSCGKEEAVAATISVVEQAMVYQSVEESLCDCHCAQSQEQAAKLAAQVLAEEYDSDLIAKIAAAPVIYLAGRNNGVAEELALKTNEITRKRSQYLEGTIVVHGIEEVMNPEDVIILMDPFEQDAEFYRKNLVDGVGATVIAIAANPSKTIQSLFHTIAIPKLDPWNAYLQLFAGWNLLVQTGIACGIDIDKPKRARKIGNAVD